MKYIIIFFLASSICYSFEIKDIQKQYDKHIKEIKIEFLKKLKKRIESNYFRDEYLKKELLKSYSVNFKDCRFSIAPQYAFKDTFKHFKMGDDIIKYIDFSKYIYYDVFIYKDDVFLTAMDMSLIGYTIPDPEDKKKTKMTQDRIFWMSAFNYIGWYIENNAILMKSELEEFKAIKNKEANNVIQKIYTEEWLKRLFDYQQTRKQLYIDNMKEWREPKN